MTWDLDLNSSKTTDSEIEESLHLMAESLFSMCVTLGTLPIIRAPKETAAEMLAQVTTNLVFSLFQHFQHLMQPLPHLGTACCFRGDS